MTYELHHGDCLEIMPTLTENSVDTIITDPPYGLDFMGKNWDKGVPGEAFWKEALRVAKPGAVLLAFGGTRTFHRLTCAIEDAGWEIRDCIMWIYGTGFPKSLDIGKAIDKAKGEKRQVIGTLPAGSAPLKNGHVHKGGGGGLSIGTERSPEINITIPSSELAQQWDGWGTAFKPAWEPIIVAQKPLDVTYANNAEKWGVAGLWIDGGRIPTQEELKAGGRLKTNSGDTRTGKALGMFQPDTPNTFEKHPQGRFPANLILDEESAQLVDKQSGVSKSQHSVRKKAGLSVGNGITLNSYQMNTDNEGGYTDTGGASRFFYTAKASRSERGEGNIHPTVKPLSLMRYLARLTKTPTGGVVLDPFMGSGSTGVGCLLEGRSFVGIENDTEHGYFEIAQNRLENTMRGIEIENKKPKTLRMKLE